ncbi:MAG: maleylpyruvate isomerase family mycothiol-dependent enzyme [Nocardioides sp.]
MTNLVDQTIAELRANHDRLAAFVVDVEESQLKGPSGASEWTVADVLSHLGSGAEIQRHTIAHALGDVSEAPPNQAVWDRWDALPPVEQAHAFVEADERLVALYESLTDDQRESTTVHLGFLPEPVPVVVPLALRLNEQTLHGWDARVGIDPRATLDEEAAELMFRHYATTTSFLLGFIGKSDRLAQTLRLAVRGYTLVIDDGVTVEQGTLGTTATYVGPLEAVLRLLAGRLAPEQTPDDVRVTGNVTLDELREVFPGY